MGFSLDQFNGNSAELHGLYDLPIISDNLNALNSFKARMPGKVFLYTPSQSDGNRLADSLAKVAARSNRHPEDVRSPLTKNSCLRIVDDFIVRLECTNWNSVVPRLGDTIRKLLTPFPVLQKLEPHMCRGLFLMVQGHNHCPRHMKLRSHRLHDHCSFCGSSEARSFHFLLDCPGFSEQRKSALGVERACPKDLWRFIEASPECAVEYILRIGILAQPRRLAIPRT